jgi:hypothetical protein
MRKFLVAAVVIALPFAVALAGGDTKSVQLREAAVRAGPKHFKPLVATLAYADKVEVVSGPDAGWFAVRLADGRTGYMHETALTDAPLTRVAAGAGTQGGGQDEVAAGGKGFAPAHVGAASQDEVALAGKGFNPQVEKQYRADHRELEEGFRKVDLLSKRRVSDADERRFLADGKLGDAAGEGK